MWPLGTSALGHTVVLAAGALFSSGFSWRSSCGLSSQDQCQDLYIVYGARHVLEEFADADGADTLNFLVEIQPGGNKIYFLLLLLEYPILRLE